MKRVQSYAAPGITVTFDPNLCIHSAVCLRTLPAVFDVRRRRWVDPGAASAAEIVDAVGRCPSGALRYALEATAVASHEEPAIEPETAIQASRNGPLLVQGRFELLDEAGNRIETAGRVALCRCGGTANQPFCDGSHRRVGFRSKERATE